MRGNCGARGTCAFCAGRGTRIGRLAMNVEQHSDLPSLGVRRPLLTWVMIDSGGRHAQVDAAKARAQEALLVYRQTVLDALPQASKDAFAQACVLYREGLAGFLEVLDAQRTLIDNREALVRAQADVARALADFHVAPGTGPGAPDPR